MTDKKKILIFAPVAVVALVAAVLFFRVPGEKRFDFSAVDESCKVYVIRNDHNTAEFVDDEHLTQHRKYLLEGDVRQQLFSLLTDTTYLRRVSINVFTFVPGISMDSVTSHTPVDYRIVAEDNDGTEVMHIYTAGCEYINTADETWRYVKIADRKWGQKLDAILAQAQLVDTYFK